MTAETSPGLTPPSNRGVSSPVLKSVSSRVDWLTATTRDDRIGTEWLTRYQTYQQNARELVSDYKFKGFVGFGTEGWSWLVNPETNWYMTILTGLTAGEYWYSIAPKSTNVTRIDLAVTVEAVEPKPEYIQQVYLAIPEEYNRSRQYSLLQNKTGGLTLYVGNRSSYNYGRLYDKGVETGDYKPGNQFRYEVELKKPKSYDTAMEIAHRVRTGEVLEPMIVNYVYHWFYVRGLQPAFEADQNYVSPDIQARISTKDSKLTWLRTSVRPTVTRLIEAGFGREVLEALDLLKAEQLGLFD